MTPRLLEQQITDGPPNSEPTDEALMRDIAAGKPSALDQLHARYWKLLKKIVALVLSSEADVEDTLQDVFTEIWTRGSRFDGSRGKPLGWIICMTRRRAIDRLRRIRARTERSERLVLEEEQQSGLNVTQIHDDEVSVRDLGRFLREAIGTLPAEQGHVVHLTYFQAMSQREIAQHTGVPLGTIKTRLELAKSKLLQQLSPLRAELSFKR